MLHCVLSTVPVLMFGDAGEKGNASLMSADRSTNHFLRAQVVVKVVTRSRNRACQDAEFVQCSAISFIE